MGFVDLNVVIDAQIYKDKLKLLLYGSSHTKSYIGITRSLSYTNLISNVILPKLSFRNIYAKIIVLSDAYLQLIQTVTIISLFISGCIFVATGISFSLFGTLLLGDF